MFLFSFLKLGFDFVAGRAVALFNMKMQIAEFFMRHIRVISVLAILFLSLWYVHSLRAQVSAAKSETIVAKKALLTYVNANAESARLRDIENKAKRVQGKLQTAALSRMHRNETLAILAHANQTIDKTKRNAKNEKILSDSKLASLRDGLQLAVERQANTIGLPQNDADRLATADSNAALPRPIQKTELSVCQEAGAVCAADYNFCHDYVESEQKRLGVENE